jgi:hypothetical protein
MILSDLPWWVKLAAKVGLSLVPVPYDRVRYLLTGYRGGMEETHYATEVFQKYIREYDSYSNSSHSSLLELGPGGVVKTPYSEGTTNVIFEPLDLIAKLAALVAKPRVNLTRFHGVLFRASCPPLFGLAEAVQHRSRRFCRAQQQIPGRCDAG